MLDELRKEFNDEFDTLSSDDRLTLSNYLKKYDPESSMAIRSLPSDRVADVDILFDTLKGLVRANQCFPLFMLNDDPVLVVEMSMRRRWFHMYRKEHPLFRHIPKVVFLRARYQHVSSRLRRYLGRRRHRLPC